MLGDATFESSLSGSNEHYITEAESILQNTKGEELAESVDPQRLNLIFWKLSKPWRDHAQELIDEAYSLCLAFLRHMINVCLSEKLPGMPQTIFQTIISYLKEKQKDQAREELKKLEEDRKRPARLRETIG